MKKIGLILLAIVAVVLGLLVGTLNSDPVQLDLLWTQLKLPLGLTILMGFSLGLIAGLLTIYFVGVLPLRLKLRKALTALTKHEAARDQEIPGKNASSEISSPDA